MIEEEETIGAFEQERLKAPFPYYGGKSKVAHIVWDALGDCKSYIEPFFGSGAVLLARPGFDPSRHVETVNDKDGNISNVWRSIQYSPDEVAKWCDWPVNHCDLAARRKVLIANEDRLLSNLIADPEWHDPKLAGYWIWAASCWIGSGLTRPNAGVRLTGFAETGVHSGKRPQLTGWADKGVNAVATGGGRNHRENPGNHSPARMSVKFRSSATADGESQHIEREREYRQAATSHEPERNTVKSRCSPEDRGYL
jgi:hypothetical protein